MASGRPKAFLTGAGIVWRRQRVLWMLFVVGLFFAYLGTREPVARLGGALDHSAEAAPRLYHAFDMSAVSELEEQPDEPLQLFHPNFLYFPILYGIFMLFATGGILAAYCRDARMTTGEFFGACGYHFWRFFRLLIYFAIVSIPVLTLISVCSAIHDRIDESSISPMPAVRFFLGSTVVIVFLATVVRLWFDMAQVIAVTDDEKAMHRALRQAASLLWHNFWSLFWLYLRISIIGTVGFGFGLYLWMMRLRPESTTSAFFLAQAMILLWIATRLWQRGSEAAWYGKYQAAAMASAPPAPVTAPVPAIVTMS